MQAQAASDGVPPPGPTAAPQTLERVELNAQRSDEERRRHSIAGKITLSKADIARWGDSKASEALERLPGVTVVDGQVVLRGMGGYTQLLVNGMPPPLGLNIADMPASRIERIELVRSGLAEFSAQGIAGTINVVLKEAPPAAEQSLSTELSGPGGSKLSPSLDWSRADTLGESYRYLLNASLMSGGSRIKDQRELEIQTLSTGSRDRLQQQRLYQSDFAFLNLGGELRWTPSATQSLAIKPRFDASEMKGENDLALQGDTRAFAQRQSRFKNRTTGGGLAAQWNRQLSHGQGLELNLQFAGMSLDRSGDSLTIGRSDRTGPEQRVSSEQGNRRDQSLRLEWTGDSDSEHRLRAGLELERGTQSGSSLQLLNGAPDPLLPDFAGPQSSKRSKYASFLQDEWSEGPWSFNLGLRWEGQALQLQQGTHAASTRLGLWAPSGHVLWRRSENSPDQVRLGLSRSYQPPRDEQLLQVVQINPQYQCSTAATCGANSAAFPDRAGNSALRPEIASGIDLGWEHFRGKDGLLSVNIFSRQLRDHILEDTQLERVDWAQTPRYVTRPYNFARALIRGLELEAKFRLDEVLASAPAVRMDAGLSLYRSRIESPGAPNSRLENQPRALFKLGVSHQLANLPLQLNGQFSWQSLPPFQLSRYEMVNPSRRSQLSMAALWTVSKESQLKLSLSNLLRPAEARDTSIQTPDSSIRNLGQQRRPMAWTLKFETKL